MRPLLAGAGLLLVVGFLAWTASRRLSSPHAAAFDEPSPRAARRESSVRRGGGGFDDSQVANRPGTGRLGAQKILQYGGAEGELGMIRGREQPPVGPESFAVGNDGSILVTDVVNERLVIYARNGAHDRSISLPGIAIGDVATDKQGRVYVYDQVRRALHQYDANGIPRSTLDLNPSDIDTRGYFHVVGDAVYFADAAAHDVLVATLRDGLLTAADGSAERRAGGIHAESGRIYCLSLDRGQAVRLQMRTPAAKTAAEDVVVSLPGIVGARYAGEDDARRFYVQTERLAGTNIVLEVLTFSHAGEHLATTRIPENDYAIWTTKLVDVGADGTIVQFLPQRDRAKLNLFTN